ncbi:MAG TPA: hypothetical protein VMR14_19635 [Streptosporangiaceae bacterium]|jgi:hypothetical protein|nr:hypothetical protein [Streptosporangiaceae bacterium]
MSEATVTRPGAADSRSGPSASFGRLGRWDLVEAAIAVAAFVVLCVVILRTAPFMPEPDDYAYQGSIVAMTDGHFLTLSTAQVHALVNQLGAMGSAAPRPNGFGGLPAVPQWVQLANGRWISEKDPGFPFLAVAFQWLGIIRWDQLFYGGLACVGLFAGARRWLGRFGGAAAVGLYCSSGAAILWGWRDYMPTFTDASLIAAGTGALLWAVLATAASPRRRTLAGLAGFVALEAATFARYTDVVVLACAVVAVLIAWRVRAARLPGRSVCWWLASVAVFGAGALAFDTLVYGGPLQSGYRPGEIQFSLSAVRPNLRYMPAHLMQAMPMLVLGLAALGWIIARWAWRRTADARLDLLVGVALFASWLAVWGLYSAYTWTANPFGTTLQAARFYVPALGAIALLGAWLVTRIPWHDSRPALSAIVTVAVVAVMFASGIGSFHAMLTGSPIAINARPCVTVPHKVINGPHGPIRCASFRPGPGSPRGPRFNPR